MQKISKPKKFSENNILVPGKASSIWQAKYQDDLKICLIFLR